jgi:CheY-like chemotaxis protein
MTRVLIVEDNAAHMQLAAYLLQLGGYEVLQASDAETGIALAAKEHPDLILMDVRLPGMDGVAAIQALKASRETFAIRIIAMTSYRGDYQGSVRASGADAFIEKPFHYDHLLGIVKTVLEQPQA